MRRRLLSAAVCLLLILCMPAVGVTATSERMRVGYYPLEGYQTINAGGFYSGYGYEYLQLLANYTDWDYAFTAGDIKECKAKMQTGELDMVGFVIRSPEHEAFFDFPDLPAGMCSAALRIRGDDTRFAYDDYAALNGIRVGVVNDYGLNDSLNRFCEENWFSVTVVEYADMMSQQAALHAGEVDALLGYNLFVNPDEKTVASFDEMPFYYAVRKGNAQLLNRLNVAQTKLNAEKPYIREELHKKYFGNLQSRPMFTTEEIAYLDSLGTLRVVGLTDDAPFEYVNRETGAFEGIVPEVMRRICDIIGLKIEYVSAASIQEAETLMKTGGADLMDMFQYDFNWGSTFGVLLSETYLSTPVIAVTNVSVTNEQTNVTALNQNAWVGRYVERSAPQERYLLESNSRACLDDVASGRAGKTFINSYAIDELLKEPAYSELKAMSLPNDDLELCIAISQQQDALLRSIINKALGYLSEDEIDAIVAGNTAAVRDDSFLQVMYRYPVESVSIIGGVLLLIIGVLVYVIVVRIRARKKVNEALYQDSVTGFWNFNRFREEVDLLLKETDRPPYAIMYLDIEQFSYINDTYGYAEGDALLRRLAEELRKFVQKGEVFGRVSADNFVLLIQYQQQNELEWRLNALKDQIDSLQKGSDTTYSVVVIGGMYLLNGQDKDVSVIIDKANQARKSIRGVHTTTFRQFSTEMWDQIKDEFELSRQMEDALRRGEFVPYFQPKVDAVTGQIVSAEELVRWQHPQRGNLSPAQFIPLFEKNGFIVQLDLHMFEQVCKILRERLDTGKPVVPIACNFSKIHFMNEEFPHTLNEIADRYQLDRGLLEIEVTETVAMQSFDSIIGQIQLLRSMGFTIAIDDFGSGYSSLGLLKLLPVQVLKLDRSFVEEETFGRKEDAIIGGIISIAHDLDMMVVCEGVETEHQLAMLREAGCDVVQGFLFFRPLPGEQFDRQLGA